VNLMSAVIQYITRRFENVGLLGGFWLLALLALASGASPAMAQRNTVKTEHVRAELVAYAPEGVAAGKQMWLGLQFEHAAHWHTYWKNPGDIGRPTQLNWNLPQGVTAGEIDWPAPQKLLIPPVVDYGYEGVILLPVPVTVGSEFKGSELDVKLKAAWLACRSTCIPESGEFALTVPASGTSTHKAAFEAAWAARPVPLPGVRGSATVEGDSLVVSVTGLTASAHNGQIEILREIPRLIDHAALVVTAWKGDLLEARMPLRKRHDELPASLPVVLKFGDGDKQAARVELVSGAATPAATAANTTETAGPQGATNQPLFMALLLALVGGVILNLTPCVFPVLSLNILRMTKHAGERRATVMSGIAYTVGVVASLLILAGALLFFRAVGMQLGWGFQLGV
jgi:DsbC/DsbD-like thiol-disulfide interchange protein